VGVLELLACVRSRLWGGWGSAGPGTDHGVAGLGLTRCDYVAVPFFFGSFGAGIGLLPWCRGLLQYSQYCGGRF
jgi:hypothetical protein